MLVIIFIFLHQREINYYFRTNTLELGRGRKECESLVCLQCMYKGSISFFVMWAYEATRSSSRAVLMQLSFFDEEALHQYEAIDCSLASKVGVAPLAVYFF